MKSALVFVVGISLLYSVKANWFSEVVAGIQEGIKESFEEAQKHAKKAEGDAEKTKEGVKEFLNHLNNHVKKWQKKFAEQHGLNESKIVTKKAKKLWKKLQKHVLTKIMKGQATEDIDEKSKKPHKKQQKKHYKKSRKEDVEKEHKNEGKIAHESDFVRIPLKKDDTFGRRRLIKAQKIFSKLANMWSNKLKEEGKDYHGAEEKKEESKKDEEEEPTPTTVIEPEVGVKEEPKENEFSVLENPQQIAKTVLDYAKLIKMPKLDVPKEKVIQKTVQFFQMHKPKDLETGPHMTKEEEEKIGHELDAAMKHEKDEAKDEVDDTVAKAERIIKAQEKKFHELEEQWEKKIEERASEAEAKMKKLPNIKQIPAKTILPAFIKMETIPGHRELPQNNEHGLIGGKEDVDRKEELPPTVHELLLPNMGKEKEGPEEGAEEELWMKFQDNLKAEKVSPEEFAKMPGDLPDKLEHEEEEEEDDDEEEEEPSEPTVQKEEEKKPVEIAEPTLNPVHEQELDDEEFRRKLMQEEEEFMKFKQKLVKKLNKLKQRVKQHPWKQFKSMSEDLHKKGKSVPVSVMEGIAEMATSNEKQPKYEEP